MLLNITSVRSLYVLYYVVPAGSLLVILAKTRPNGVNQERLESTGDEKLVSVGNTKRVAVEVIKLSTKKRPVLASWQKQPATALA
jgi:hypothetical protein